MSETTGRTCPHCGSGLERVALPDAIADHAYDLVCFNDDCSYYARGWAWMEQQFGVRTSYRYRLNPSSGCASPIAVWSPSALRSSIVSGDAQIGDKA